MSVVWKKVWRDLFLKSNRLRTLLVVLSTAVGIFALGLVFGLYGMLRDRMTESHRATKSPHLIFYSSAFSDEIVQSVLREEGVADAERVISSSIRWRLPDEEKWQNGDLIAREDYEGQRMALVTIQEGQWPIDGFAVERQSSKYYDVPLGSDVIVEVGHYEHQLHVDGIVHNPSVYPPQFGGNATFYATQDTLLWLTGNEDWNRLYVQLESFSQKGAEVTGEAIKQRLERMGLPVGGPTIQDPEEHFLQDQIDALTLILGVLGVLALCLSAFLTINTMNAIVVQQLRQIGIMKVVGATFSRVVRVYLTAALIYGLLASLISLPLSSIATYFLSLWILNILNVASGSFQIIPLAIVIQIIMGVLAPLLAALAPTIGGARISAYQAISNYGLGGRFGRGWFDRLIGRVRNLPRLAALSIRNTFRRKGRLSLTLLTLVMGGMMFIMVLSVNRSLNNTLEVLIQDLGLDVWIGFDRLYRTDRLIEIAEQIPGVLKAEVWDQRAATLALEGGNEREAYVWGVPTDSSMFMPRLEAGRSLLPGDGRAILLNRKIAQDEGIRVGDKIELIVEGRESVWTVVGIIINVNNLQRENFVPFDSLAQETGSVNRGPLVMVKTESKDPDSQERVMNLLNDTFITRGMEVSVAISAQEVRDANKTQFDAITYLMLIMAILAAMVGSIGLMGAMSINVVERGREIGVMRSAGATSMAIGRIFVGEGILVGFLSWLIAAPLSYPGAKAFSSAVGIALELPLDFIFSSSGVVLWLVIVLILSTVASLWPALLATRVSVQESLAYE
ncbi:MAG: FtsX-like permease family protein [Anaerolineales bacterium]|nr:FtsX-like permease family protein [Anaerolineales bacterium]